MVSKYMAQMMQSGYSEQYRKNILCRALRIYDTMNKDDQDGVRPLYRPRDWQAEERRQKKQKKKHNWSAKGGKISPIFVPPTPNGELARQLKEIAETEAEDGVQFRIVETGGRSVKSVVQISNPTATAGCVNTGCLACKTGRGVGGNCQKSSINYQIDCQLCPADERSTYIGETARNLLTRGKEHTDRYWDRTKKSFMKKHQDRKHQGQPGNYTAKVTGSSKDCLTRQVREAVLIRRSQVPVLNSKTEWHEPALWRIQTEMYRG